MNTIPFNIREYSPSDRHSMESLIANFQDEEGAMEPDFAPGKEVASLYLDQLIPKQQIGHLLVAEAEEAIAGFTCFYYNISIFCHFSTKEVVINDIYVAPQFRGKGLARHFITLAENYAHERKAEGLTLKVLSRNKPARSLYTNTGFREFEITMTKPLGDHTPIKT